MASVLTNWFGNKVLVSNLLKNGAWIALHSGDPGATGSYTDEFAGGGYEREYVLFDNPSGKTIATATKVIFPSLPSATLSFISLGTGHIAGNMYLSFIVSPSISIPSSSHFVIPAGDIAVAI